MAYFVKQLNGAKAEMARIRKHEALLNTQIKDWEDHFKGAMADNDDDEALWAMRCLTTYRELHARLMAEKAQVAGRIGR